MATQRMHALDIFEDEAAPPSHRFGVLLNDYTPDSNEHVNVAYFPTEAEALAFVAQCARSESSH